MLKRTDDLENIILHADNAPPHRSSDGTDAVAAQGFEVLQHPPYSPDLAPNDFAAFPQLKDMLRGTHFESDEELKQAVMQSLKDLLGNGCQDIFRSWVRRHQKCIDARGEYFEKE